MAEAYASLVSVMQILDQLKNHPRPPISLDKQQVQSLTQNVTFLQDCRQVYNNHVGYSKEVDAIANAAHAVEDVIESHIVDQILADGEEISSVDFYEALQKVIDDMELLKSEIKDMREKTGVDSSTSAASTWQNHTMVGYDYILSKEVSSIDFDSFEALQKVIDDTEIMKIEIMDLMGKIGVNSSAFVASSTFASTWQNHTTVGSDDILLEEISSVNSYEAMQKVVDYMELAERELMDLQEKIGTWQNHTMVGFDNILLEVVDKLTSQKSSRRIISISGMGGIGKTTLATNAYKHDYVVQHFDFLAWFTISRVCNIGKILRKVLMENGEDLSQVGENDLGNKLHQLLTGRSYLIIMDDIWNIEVWDRLKLFLPDNNNGSRIMITTRLSNLARLIEGSHNIVMDFLDQDNSWKLFCQYVFGKQDCPLELKEIGKNIVRGCKGLPLSISVVGGLLAKSKRTQQYWEYIAENLNSRVNLEDNEHCLQILYMSYNSLQIHLKPCFLYVGCIGEDEEISISALIAMWVGEGFVRSIHGKSLEEVAREYVTELIDRNLLINKEDKSGSDGILFEICKIHNLLRDLCLREAEKQKFRYVAGDLSRHNISRNIRRICANTTPEEDVRTMSELNLLHLFVR